MTWLKGVLAAAALSAVIWLLPQIIVQLTQRLLPKCLTAGMWTSARLAALFGTGKAEAIETAFQTALTDAYFEFMRGCDLNEEGKDKWRTHLANLLDS